MKKTLLVSFFLLMVFLTVNFVQANNVRSGPFDIYFPSGSSLGFQNYPEYVLLSVISGSLNSSDTSLSIYEHSGQFVFLSNTTTIIEISFTVMNVKVAGDNGNELRAITNETNISIGANDRVSIIWDIASEIWLPIGFIMGMVGLFSMFGGSLFLVNELKQKNYEKGLETGVIFMALGIALVLVWLWP